MTRGTGYPTQRKPSMRSMLRRLAWMSAVNERLGAISNMTLADIRKIKAALAPWSNSRMLRIVAPGLRTAIKTVLGIVGNYPDEGLFEGLLMQVQRDGGAKVDSPDVQAFWPNLAYKDAEAKFKEWLIANKLKLVHVDVQPDGAMTYLIEEEKGEPHAEKSDG